MKKHLLLFLVVFVCLQISGQNRKRDLEVEIVNHEVQLGESVRLISKKYLVDPAEIYKLNKFAVDGISQGMILKIPVPKKDEPLAQQEESGPAPVKVQAVDNASVESPEKTVTAAATGTKTVKTEAVNENSEPVVYERTSDTHTVVPKETLYSLSRKYGVSVDDLKNANPELQTAGLKVGQLIKLPSANGSSQTTKISNDVVAQKKESVKPAQVAATTTDSRSDSETITHVVAPKETLYSLSKTYNVTIDEIKQQNQALLTKGLQIGQKLTIRKH